ncbi:hypothetical protein P153DRAFT_431471 [Dothidotthia symphoricarpi CBS 119687]|uniref:Uncharacterized protein n=1 Tax=Dothidotthia symphoricarpi CBS 119687 TaxID=1392245 RepID=A0A6A6AEK4_9PLEO|nr:uncharacterized protein P153DRAFT_431471 [Dothidotthia symphoricarpi CBS 119687]KAF2129535.1 hypothetical protein P153DRAFT_431471 [Dothidotthia symphoricarpi CBS 119687]
MPISSYGELKLFAAREFLHAFHRLPEPTTYTIKLINNLPHLQIGRYNFWWPMYAAIDPSTGRLKLLEYSGNPSTPAQVKLNEPFACLWPNLLPQRLATLEMSDEFEAFARYCIMTGGYDGYMDAATYNFPMAFRKAAVAYSQALVAQNSVGTTDIADKNSEEEEDDSVLVPRASQMKVEELQELLASTKNQLKQSRDQYQMRVSMDCANCEKLKAALEEQRTKYGE